jgi:uncharacterized YigZ family protein
MLHLAHEISAELIVKKSRFVALALPIESETAARTALSARMAADANHNCWAWRIGQAYRFSDDGEPGGTAGKPILAAMDGLGVDHVLVIVARWFGGVLLGTGGLVRAYGGAASACLRAGTLVPFVATIEARLALGFADLALVKARLASLPGLSIAGEHFTADGAELDIRLPEAELAQTSVLVADLTSGRSRLMPDI